MSIQIVDATYVPDLDGARIPGALIGMTGFAPLQRGPYGSVSANDVFQVLGVDVLRAQTFRQVDDSVRLLVFSKEKIHEYTTAGVRTERGSGYSASTTDWDAAAWGNNIYACNKLDATQVSTGAAFAAVGDDCPKARYIAANVNFVMLADTHDGSDDLSDQVWWSALQNPTEWTPAIATQAGKVRLLDAPGPIKQLVAFRDLFVAFKESSVFVGEYVGPPYIFQWRMVSSRIGLSAPNGVVELDDKLYWVHTSGIYQWDGNTLQNIGLPVWQSILNQFGHNGYPAEAEIPSPGAGFVATSIGQLRLAADDVDGVVWLSCYAQKLLDSTYNVFMWGYNARTNKWATVGAAGISGVTPQPWVTTTHADMRAFLATTMPAQARVWYLDNRANGSDGGVSLSTLRDLRYPDAWGSDITGSVSTAAQGTPERSTDAMRVYARCLPGSDAAPFSACTLYGYVNESRSLGTQTATCVLNAELDSFDGRLSTRFKLANLVGTRNKWCLLAGIGIEYPQTGGR
jgi:hypothetical protein